ncbi:oxidoreductase [Raoultibacter phocaeensis]|uniref:oxidoreductase n=1 Tax=Raoultibacter phocaeensis TaxID=2479841 RepID=UPI00111B6990|nr:FAD-dependent oxidoreductase [Raoultibacter phocaeensis]
MEKPLKGKTGVAGISRRSFVGGAALAAIGATAASALALPGCSPAPSNSAENKTASNTEAASSPAAIAELNPQDDSYDSYSGDVSALFSPITIGSMNLKNRIVKSAAGSDTMPKGATEMSQNAIDYYGLIADGGAALIILETGTLSPFGLTNGSTPSEQGIIEAQKIADRIHQADAYVGVQFGLGTPLSPITQVNDYTTDEIKALVKDCGEAALRLKNAGFDCVEMKGATTDVLNQFLSRSRNFRDDEYGAQNNENRVRLFKEIVEEIRAQCGKDFPILTLINAVEEMDSNLGDNDGFIVLEEAQYLAQELEKSGADFIQIRVGVPGQEVTCYGPDCNHTGYKMDGATGFGTQFDYSKHFGGLMDGSHSGVGGFIPLAKKIKEVVDIPVGCAGNMDVRLAPDLINSAVANGDIDLVFINRMLVVDPELPKKLEEGRRDEIAPCTKCFHCHARPLGEAEMCRVNATTQFAYTEEMPEGYELPPAQESKNVMVVGGGPAGMEAARIAALRGHTVTLYEQKESLGGLLGTAQAFKGTHERLNDLKDYLTRQLEVANVQTVTGQAVDTDFVKSENPDVVLVAAGGLRESKLSSSSSVNVMDAGAIELNEIKDDVVIVGGNLQAVDIASFLVAQGKQVDIVNPNAKDVLDIEQSPWVRRFTLPHLYAKGVKVYNEAEAIEVTDNGLIITMQDCGLDKEIPCQTVIECWDMVGNTALIDDIAAAGIEVHAVGCDAPKNIQSAIHAGNIVARSI